MSEEDMIVLIVVCALIGLNLISLLLMYTTKVGRYFYDNLKATKPYKIFYNFWMVLTGVTFWIQVLYVRVKYGKVWEK